MAFTEGSGPYLALPKGFSYVVFAKTAAPMPGGEGVFARNHDGMAAFALADGRIRLTRNQEDRNRPGEGTVAGPTETKYDPGRGWSRCSTSPKELGVGQQLHRHQRHHRQLRRGHRLRRRRLAHLRRDHGRARRTVGPRSTATSSSCPRTPRPRSTPSPSRPWAAWRTRPWSPTPAPACSMMPRTPARDGEVASTGSFRPRPRISAPAAPCRWWLSSTGPKPTYGGPDRAPAPPRALGRHHRRQSAHRIDPTR